MINQVNVEIFIKKIKQNESEETVRKEAKIKNKK